MGKKFSKLLEDSDLMIEVVLVVLAILLYILSGRYRVEIWYHIILLGIVFVFILLILFFLYKS